MAPLDNTAPHAPVMNLPLQHLVSLKPQHKALPKAQSKVQSKAQHEVQEVTKANPTVNEKLGPKAQLRQIYDQARILNDKEDLRLKPRKDRLALLEGPSVDLICDEHLVGSIPLRLLVATSSVARNAFIEKGGKKMSQFGVSQPGVSAALQTLANYLVSVMKVHERHYSLPSTQLADDIDILMVAETLGWDHYVKNLYGYRWAILKTEPFSNIGFENLSALDERIMTFTDHFNMLNMFVARFAKDPMYGEWRAKLPNTEAAVQRRQAKWVERRTKKEDADQQCQENVLEKEEKNQEFEDQLRAARGGRSGGYGMGV
jgi:hypothetical protein